MIAALTPERFKLQITMDRETHDTLREIQDLIRHAVPSGDAGVIVARALKVLREQLLRQKAAQVKRPRARHAEIESQPEPAHTRNPGTAAEDFSLRCRAHNDYEAQLFFGAGHARRRRA